MMTMPLVLDKEMLLIGTKRWRRYRRLKKLRKWRDSVLNTYLSGKAWKRLSTGAGYVRDYREEEDNIKIHMRFEFFCGHVMHFHGLMQFGTGFITVYHDCARRLYKEIYKVKIK